MGIPATNKQVEVAGTDIYGYRDGKRVEVWG